MIPCIFGYGGFFIYMEVRMTHEELKAYWKSEEACAMSGWDFSYIEGRSHSDPLPWDYRGIVLQYRKITDSLLDMGTGGGEFLLTLAHPPQNTTVTEGYPPNAKLCRTKLSPLGITVVEADCEHPLPFADCTFDLVINRHASFVLPEIHRILRPGGVFITQQVGERNNHDLILRLMGSYTPGYPDHRLETYLSQLEQLGMEILQAQEHFGKMRFYDAGAIAWYARIIQWEFPGFCAEKNFDGLMDCHREIQKNGFVSGTEHRFLIAARKN